MTVLASRGTESDLEAAIVSSLSFPRMRYMGSKYKVVPALLGILEGLEFGTALDAFSGSGVVGYALKAMGKQVIANDFLRFSATIADATVANSSETLTPADLETITSASADGRDFIARTFKGLYFPDDDLQFLDAAWSHIADMTGSKRSIAIASLCLAAARKQPRGVFTITDLRYDDGRRQLHTPLRELFREAAAEYNSCVFDNGKVNQATCKDIFEVDSQGIDLVYLDPPYAPPRDDNCYIKRYHFLEGLSVTGKAAVRSPTEAQEAGERIRRSATRRRSAMSWSRPSATSAIPLLSCPTRQLRPRATRSSACSARRRAALRCTRSRIATASAPMPGTAARSARVHIRSPVTQPAPDFQGFLDSLQHLTGVPEPVARRQSSPTRPPRPRFRAFDSVDQQELAASSRPTQAGCRSSPRSRGCPRSS